MKKFLFIFLLSISFSLAKFVELAFAESVYFNDCVLGKIASCNKKIQTQLQLSQVVSERDLGIMLDLSLGNFGQSGEMHLSTLRKIVHLIEIRSKKNKFKQQVTASLQLITNFSKLRPSATQLEVKLENINQKARSSKALFPTDSVRNIKVKTIRALALNQWFSDPKNENLNWLYLGAKSGHLFLNQGIAHLTLYRHKCLQNIPMSTACGHFKEVSEMLELSSSLSLPVTKSYDM